MWALVDCDNFFCSCERVFRPDLIGKAVVVLSNNDGCVVARSREAKALGIKMGLPFFQMKEQFPKASVTAFSSNYTLYGDMSARVMATLRLDSPRVYQYSIDEAFIDLNKVEADDFKIWGENLSKKVYKWTGIPVSIGIAPSKTLAKVAARYAKKFPGYNKCCLIETDEQRTKALELFEVADVWGIGRRIANHLLLYGVTTAYDFTCKPRQWVKSKFHLPGERTWMELKGMDVIPVDEMGAKKKQSIMTSRSFPEMLEDIDDLRCHIMNFAYRCAFKLRQQRSVCKTVNVFIQSNFFRQDLDQYSPGAAFTFTTHTNTANEIVDAAVKVLEKIYRPGIFYKRGGVMVADIIPEAAIQPDLFEFDADRNLRLKNLSRTMDDINDRMGSETLRFASMMYSTNYNKTGRTAKFTDAIKRAMLSPCYSTSVKDFVVKI